MIKNWMLWVAIVITILLAGFIISRLPVRDARGESPAPASGNQAMERTATVPAR
jgi:cytochrome c-type biogenesis protein CcmH/NrfF